MKRIVPLGLVWHFVACSSGASLPPTSSCASLTDCCLGTDGTGIACEWVCAGGTCVEAVGAAPAELATCITIQRGTSGAVADATIRSDRATTAHGGSTNVSVTQSPTSMQHGLFSWDMSTVPTTATITSATVTFWGNLKVGSPAPVLVHEATSAWAEAGVTWTTAPSAGPSLTIGGTPIVLPTGTGVLSTALPLGTVQGWVTGPNRGLMLETDASSSAGQVIASSEDATPTRRPALTLCYTVPTCSDSIQNGAETDVDCGGGTCSTCATGQTCSVGADCATGRCTSGTCVAPAPGACITSADCAAGSYCEAGTSSWSPPGGPTCYPLGGASVATVSSCTLPAAASGAWSVSTVTYKTGLLADVYQPTGTRSGRVVLIAHPGGYGALDRTWAYCAAYAQALASRGDVAVSIDYRLAATGGVNPFPAQTADVRCAARWAAAQASSWGASSARIGCFGFSAGGHLCAHTAATAEATAIHDTGLAATIPLDDGTCSVAWASTDGALIKRVSSWYGPADLTSQPGSWVPPFLGLATSDPLYTPRATTASPNGWQHPGLPPLFLQAGSADTGVPPSLATALESAARARGVPATAVVVPSGQHFASPLWKNITVNGLSANFTEASCTNDAFMLAL